MPFAPVETTSSITLDDNSQTSRQQLQLGLHWAIVMHRIQETTVEEAVNDLGKFEISAGLTFLCLSQAKQLMDLLAKRMSFKRFSQLSKKLTH